MAGGRWRRWAAARRLLELATAEVSSALASQLMALVGHPLPAHTVPASQVACWVAAAPALARSGETNEINQRHREGRKWEMIGLAASARREPLPVKWPLTSAGPSRIGSLWGRRLSAGPEAAVLFKWHRSPHCLAGQLSVWPALNLNFSQQQPTVGWMLSRSGRGGS